MKNIQDLRSERVAIFPPGKVPIGRVLAGSCGVRISESFAFQLSSPVPAEEALEFKRGRAVFDDREIVVISLKLDGRRISLTVEGTARDADYVANELEGIVFQNADPPQPIIVAPETGCTAELDFEWTSLYSPELMSFLAGPVISAASKGGTEPYISAAMTQVQLKYQTPRDLEDQAVALSPKPFTIGPEMGRPLPDRRYVTQSPTRSEDHMVLVEELERAICRGSQ